MMSLPPSLPRFRDCVDRYDAIISDVWGVLHNGIAATDGAGDCLAEARKAGKTVVLLTNAPRPPESVAQQLAGFGISPESYDAIVSSGGVTRSLLAQRGQQGFFHLGPSRDAPLFAGLASQPCTFEAADYILCTGLYDDETEQADDYRIMLHEAAARGLPLICANPDLVVERGTTLIPCAGAIAELYETLGGTVVWVGKPHPLVYQHAMDAIETLSGKTIEKARILCIGDAFRTDIAGAISNGFDCLMTLAGIHGAEIELLGGSYNGERFNALASANKTRPTATTVSLIW